MEIWALSAINVIYNQFLLVLILNYLWALMISKCIFFKVVYILYRSLKDYLNV